jgi:hypothetical protein
VIRLHDARVPIGCSWKENSSEFQGSVQAIIRNLTERTIESHDSLSRRSPEDEGENQDHSSDYCPMAAEGLGKSSDGSAIGN